MATNNFIIYMSSIIASLSYCYYISSRIPKGIYRFISITPILYIFTILPLRFSTVFPTAVSFAFTTWLTNFKLIRFAFDLDYSPFHPSMSLIQFIMVTSLPIKTGVARVISSPKRLRLRLQLVCQILVLSILVRILLHYGDIVHLRIISFMYGWILFLLIDIVTAVSNAMLFVLTGLELEPSSDHPYLATSLQSFWGKWNMLVTNTLRHTIYKPIVLIFSNYKWAPLAGVLASFLVSGLMHELFVYHLSRAAPTWEMTLFFMIHGVCVVVEKVVKRWMGGRWRVPDFVATVLTVGFVVVTGVSLFIPPFIKGRVDVKMLQEYKAFAGRIKSRIS